MSKTSTADYICMAIFVAGSIAITKGGELARQQWLASPFMQPITQSAVGPSSPTAGGGNVIHLIQERPENPSAPTAAPVAIVPPEVLNRIFQSATASAKAAQSPDASAPAVDYWERLGARATELLHLDALAHNGAVINGKFRALQENLVELEYPGGAGEKIVAPRLAAVSDKTATIQEPVVPHRRIVLKLDGASR